MAKSKEKTLLVIISDRLSDLVKKGEITERYYNPGNLFKNVHILMTKDDVVSPEEVQKTVGSANLYLHTLPVSFIKTLGWRPCLLRSWVKQGVQFASQIKPDLIRCYGDLANAYLGSYIKRHLSIPMVISLHTQPDDNMLIEHVTLKERIISKLRLRLARKVQKNADIVIPVYKPIESYAARMGAKKIQVIYNVINPTNLKKKESYQLHKPPKIISVGRQFYAKNPENIIRAVAMLNAHFTLVGDGNYHQYLKEVAAQCGAMEKITFIRSIPNDVLCEMLPKYDIFATHSEYSEISKSVLEPLLTGLPVVINQRKGNPVLELQGDFMLLVENTKDAYYNAFKKLIFDDNYREQLGLRAYSHAREHWAPEKMESKVVDIYKALLAGRTI